MNPESPKSFVLWTVAVIVFAVVARVGWELGGRLCHALGIG